MSADGRAELDATGTVIKIEDSSGARTVVGSFPADRRCAAAVPT
jgi:hypothetical protein